MEFNEFKDFGIEVILKVLKKTDDEIKKYRELEDYEGVKTLKNKVLVKYEKLYSAFTSDEIKNISGDQLKSLESSLVDIMLQNGFELSYIEREIEKREQLKGKSGAEAVKNLYNFQVDELESKKSELLEKAEDLLDQEAVLEAALSEAVQDEEQMEIVEKMPEIRRAYSKISDKIMAVQGKIGSLKVRVEKIWPCDIYGTISKDDLMEIFRKTMN